MPHDTEVHRGAAQSHKSMLTLALQRAQSAVLFDGANNMPAALDSYAQACALLDEVILRTDVAEDQVKLKQIYDTYSDRMILLSAAQTDQSVARVAGLSSSSATARSALGSRTEMSAEPVAPLKPTGKRVQERTRLRPIDMARTQSEGYSQPIKDDGRDIMKLIIPNSSDAHSPLQYLSLSSLQLRDNATSPSLSPEEDAALRQSLVWTNSSAPLSAPPISSPPMIKSFSHTGTNSTSTKPAQIFPRHPPSVAQLTPTADLRHLLPQFTKSQPSLRHKSSIRSVSLPTGTDDGYAIYSPRPSGAEDVIGRGHSTSHSATHLRRHSRSHSKPSIADTPLPAEPAPKRNMSRPFWLMRSIAVSITQSSGAYLSKTIFVPHAVWTAPGMRIKAVEEKLKAAQLLTRGLEVVSSARNHAHAALLQALQHLENDTETVTISLQHKLLDDFDDSTLLEDKRRTNQVKLSSCHTCRLLG